MSRLWKAVKLATFGGAFYATYSAGVWDDGPASLNALQKKIKTCDKLRQFSRNTGSTYEETRIERVDWWNSGVKRVFHEIEKAPEHSINGGTWIINQVNQLFSVESPRDNKK